ncbi:hypothetical protein R1flu_005851 [Riccia fluitans]|uniref:t-SNARE coiled-coil homology domain-containing protein n=1 Tax=Riccia fluitans TaxID=41844 RepID=A0ABD1YYC5_9MARC
MSALDPFYLVKEEIQDSVNKLQANFLKWEALPSTAIQDYLDLSKELTSGCESIEWQVDELDRAIAVAERDPARFSIDAAEIERRKKWTSSTHSQISTIRQALQNAADTKSIPARGGQTASSRRELLRLPEDQAATPSRSSSQELDTFAYENDRQALLMRAQDQDLDEISEHVKNLGEVSLTIHNELNLQDRIMDELNSDMDHTATRLDLVQRKLSAVMKKAGWKGQIPKSCRLGGGEERGSDIPWYTEDQCRTYKEGKRSRPAQYHPTVKRLSPEVGTVEAVQVARF